MTIKSSGIDRSRTVDVLKRQIHCNRTNIRAKLAPAKERSFNSHSRVSAMMVPARISDFEYIPDSPEYSIEHLPESELLRKQTLQVFVFKHLKCLFLESIVASVKHIQSMDSSGHFWILEASHSGDTEETMNSS